MLKINFRKLAPFILVFIVFFLDEKIRDSHFLTTDKWYILAFFLALFTINESLIFLAFENKRENFIQFFLASVTVRMVLSMIFLAFFIFSLAENSQSFAILFLVLYLFFTFFEILDINRKLRRFSKEEKIVEKK